MDYLLHILTLIGVYTILAVSLDLLAGHTGLLSVAHAAFYGLGAYASGLLSVHLNCPFIVGVVIGMGVASLASLLVSLPSLRLRGDFFVIAAFGFQMILFSVFNNMMNVTRGPLGIPGIPAPSVFGWSIRSPLGFALLAWAFAAFSYLIVGRLTASPFGRVLRAIREDEDFARALGKNTVRARITAFAVSAALAASAGSVYAHYASYIDPSSFTVMESILVVSMVVIGGAGSRRGPIIGAIALVVLPELLRFLGMPGGMAANVRQILYGGLLVGMLVLRPRGLVGRYEFGR